MERPWDYAGKKARGEHGQEISADTSSSCRAWAGNIMKCTSQNRIFFFSSKPYRSRLGGKMVDILLRRPISYQPPGAQ